MPEDVNNKKQGKFKIKIKTLEGNLLVYRDVVSYELDDGLIKFIDTKSHNLKIFSVANCEIAKEDIEK